MDTNSTNTQPNKPTPGGVVSLQDIINQIHSINAGLVAVVDAIQSNTTNLIMTIKVKRAKRTLKKTGYLLKELLSTTAEVLSEIAEELVNSDVGKDLPDLLSKLLGDGNGNINANINGIKEEDAVKQSTTGKAGLIPQLLAIFTAIKSIQDIKAPNPIVIRIKLMLLTASLKMLTKRLPIFADSLKDLQEQLASMKLNVKPFENFQKIVAALNNICSQILLLALFIPITVMVMPALIVGMAILALGIHGIVLALFLMGSPQNITAATVATLGVRRLLKVIIHNIRLIAVAIAWIAGVIVIITLLGLLIPKVFGMFLIGLLTIIALMGVLFLSMKLLAKISLKAAWVSKDVLIAMLIISLAILGVTLSLMIITMIAPKAEGHLMTIVALVGILMLVMAGIAGFMALCSLVAPFVMMGAAVMGLITFGIMCMIVIISLLWVMNEIMKQVDVESIKESTTKLMSCVETVIQSLFQADIAGPLRPNGETDGLVGAAAFLIGGPILYNIASLIFKVAILAVTVVALAVILLLAGVLLGITKLYQSHKDDFARAGEDTVAIINICAKVINALLTAKSDSMENSNNIGSEGVLMHMIRIYISDDLADLLKLIMRVAIVLLTIVVLAMVMLLMTELLWIQKFYNNNKSKLEEVPKDIAAVINVCALCIRAILQGKFSSFKDNYGAFTTLVSLMLGSEVSTVINLVFKIIIVALTMITLAMVRLLITELMWIRDVYKENETGINEIPDIVGNIMDVCSSVINSIINAKPDFAVDDSQGFLLKAAQWAFGDIAVILGLVFKIAFMAVAMFTLSMVMVLMNSMSKVYNAYQKMGGKSLSKNMKDAVKDIMNASTTILAQICAGPSEIPDEGHNSPVTKALSAVGLDKLLNYLGMGAIVSFIDLVSLFPSIALTTISLLTIVSLSKMMLSCWITYQKMGGPNIGKNAVLMIKGLFNAAQQIVNTIKTTKIDFGDADVKNASTADKVAIKAIESVFGHGWSGLSDILSNNIGLAKSLGLVAGMISVTNLLKESQEPLKQGLVVVKDVRSTIGEILSEFDNIVSSIVNTELEGVEKVDASIHQMKELLTSIAVQFNNLLSGEMGNPALFSKLLDKSIAFEQVVNANSQFVSDINGLNIAKAQAIAKVFGNAAAFSNSIKGNIGELAKTITNLTTKTVTELKDAIEKADTHIEENANKFKQAANEIGQKASEVIGKMNSSVTSINGSLNSMTAAIKQMSADGAGGGMGGSKLTAEKIAGRNPYKNNGVNLPLSANQKQWSDDDVFTNVNGYPAIRVVVAHSSNNAKYEESFANI